VRGDGTSGTLAGRATTIIFQGLRPESRWVRIKPQHQLGLALLHPAGEAIAERFGDRGHHCWAGAAGCPVNDIVSMVANGILLSGHRRGRVRPFRVCGQTGYAPLR
jgi:hypothetical protein